VCASIHLQSKRAWQLDIFLIAVENVSYLILIWRDRLGVHYKYLCYYNKHSSDNIVSLVAGLCSFNLHLVFMLCTEVLNL
jgi:hypothetical protein